VGDTSPEFQLNSMTDRVVGDHGFSDIDLSGVTQ
jgi:hypothetical protein